jgi:hypothetical protein
MPGFPPQQSCQIMQIEGLFMCIDPNELSEIPGQVRRIQGSKRFVNAPKAKNLLNYIVEKAMAGLEGDLKEILIAQALYGKGANFDPGNDRVVSQAAGDLRKRLIEYYADEGQTDQCVIAIPTGSFVPEFRARSGPRPMATPAPSPGAGKVAAKSSMFVKAVGALAVLAVVLLGAVMFAQHAASKVRITSPQDGATVGPVGDVTGKGWEPKLNNYLIVEPVDQSGQRWVQAQIASAEWTRSAHFGQGDTPSGMRYRIYVLSTSTSLPIGELTKQADSPQESPAITVTLKK